MNSQIRQYLNEERNSPDSEPAGTGRVLRMPERRTDGRAGVCSGHRCVMPEEPVAGCGVVDCLVEAQRGHADAVVLSPKACHAYLERYSEQHLLGVRTDAQGVTGELVMRREPDLNGVEDAMERLD